MAGSRVEKRPFGSKGGSRETSEEAAGKPRQGVLEDPIRREAQSAEAAASGHTGRQSCQALLMSERKSGG